MNLRIGLGYNYLSPQEQQVYKIMLKSFSSMAAAINSSQINRNVDFMKVMQTVLGDNPSVIYFDKTKIEIEESSKGRNIFLTGIQSRAQAKKMNSLLEEKANRITSSIKSNSNDDYSLLINLYESMQKNIRYDAEELSFISKGLIKNPVSHNAYGAIINKLAVCDGFSSAFSLLAQKLGFESMQIIGRSIDSSTLLIDHAWNIIKIGNRYYHMDITGDTRKREELGEFSYSYFALTDAEIVKDHKWNKSIAPVCSFNDFSYYLKNGLYVSNSQQLKEIVKAYRRKSSNVIRFKVSNDIKLPNNTGEYFANMILKEFVKPGERKQANYSWNEHTRCFIIKIL